jgi:hypothetical protein
MALVTTKSILMSNYDAQPRILSSGYLAGANDTVSISSVAAVSTDSIGSIYQYGFLPSGVRIEDIQMLSDATTAGVWNLGIYTNNQQSLNLNGVSGPSSGLGGFYPTWNSTTAYVTGNVVISNGVVYTASAGSTNSAPPSGNWTTGGSAIVPPSTLVIASAVSIFGSGISTAAAKTNWTSVYTPKVTTITASASNALLRVWELLGMQQDPYYEFTIALTASTAPTANGNIALQYSWVR